MTWFEMEDEARARMRQTIADNLEGEGYMLVLSFPHLDKMERRYPDEILP